MVKFSQFVFSFIIIALASNVYASDTDKARSFIRSISDNTLKVIENPAFDNNEKEKELAKLFSEAVDTEWIGRFVLGKYWRAATEEQREQYTKLYQKFLIGSYVPRFKEYTNERISILKVVEKETDEFLVKTEIVRPKEPAIKVDYLVRKKDSRLIIYDVIAEGISLITTQRSEFGSVISRKGLSYLIDRLEIRVAEMTVSQRRMIEAAI
ncbi:MAG: ABC transporter substrate-binding protein [Rickettsiales bacterium]|nr:ABC transporter substrate-binding protein [Rickettsiales bacterium]